MTPPHRMPFDRLEPGTSTAGAGALLLPVAMGSPMEVLPWRLWAEGNSTGWARALVGKWVVGGAEFSVWHPLSPVLSVKGTRTKPRACSWDLCCGHRPLCPGQLGEPGGSIGWAGGQAWAWKLLLCLGLRAQEVPSSSPALPWTGSHLGSAPPLDVGVHTKTPPWHPGALRAATQATQTKT